MPKTLPEIEAKENELRLAMLDSDLVQLEALLHPELIFSGPDGSWVGKAEDLDSHRAGVMKLSQLDFGDREIRHWGDAAVVVVDAEMAGQFGGEDFNGRFRYTRVWRKEDAGWRVVVGHCSQVG